MPKRPRVRSLAELATTSPSVCGALRRTNVRTSIISTEKLERSSTFLSENWYTKTAYHGSLYLLTEMLTSIIIYYPAPMTLFQSYKSSHTLPRWRRMVILTPFQSPLFTPVKRLINHPRRTKASKFSSEYLATVGETNSYMETSIFPEILNDSIEKTKITFPLFTDSYTNLRTTPSLLKDRMKKTSNAHSR